jgi:hypothetical protein
VSVAEFVDGVDRLLTRAHEMFPATTSDGGAAFSGGDGGGGSVPAAPAGQSGLSSGAAMAGGVYTRAQTTVAGLDTESRAAVMEAGAIGAQGFAGSGVIRDQARAQAAAIAPMSNSAAGMRLLVATMDAHVAGMQQQIGTTNAQNQALTTLLRATGAGYQMAGFGNGGPPLNPAPPPPSPPTPPLHGVPKPLQDFTQYTIHGIPVPPPPPPNVTADELRLRIMQQNIDSDKFLQWYNANMPKAPNFGAFLAALGGTAGSTGGLLATLPGLPEDLPLTVLAGSGVLGSLYALYQTMVPGSMPDWSQAPGGAGYTIPPF